MKKSVLILSVCALSASLYAQVLSSTGVKNTTWSGFGRSLGGETNFYGLTDTLQARYDVGHFTVEGMLNYSFLANSDDDGNVDNFVFGTSNLNPLALKYFGDDEVTNYTVGTKTYRNAVNFHQFVQDSYYVNFLWHPTKNVDVGLGTKLNWQVGPAPRYGAWLWEADAHGRQGGFSTAYDDRSGSYAQTSSEAVGTYRFYVDEPGSADVVGFVPYANKYAKRAFGIRYKDASSSMPFEIGAAIPNGFNTDKPVINVGLALAPAKWLKLAGAYEGLLQEGGNFYSGATFGMDSFTLDAYLALDSLGTDEKDDQAYATGAAITFIISGITLRPELGVSLFENDDYSAAWYAGCDVKFPLNEQIVLKGWASFAVGSADKNWDDNDDTKDWDGGHILNIRPSIDFIYSKNWTFSAYVDWEKRQAFDGKDRNCWASGVYATYKL